MSAHQILRICGRAPHRRGRAVYADMVAFGRVRPLSIMIVCRSNAEAVAVAKILRKWLRHVADDTLFNMHITYWMRRYGQVSGT